MVDRTPYQAENLAHYITQWGKDCIRYDKSPFPSLPKSSHLTRAEVISAANNLKEQPWHEGMCCGACCRV